ncbi:hypothetical protein MKK67_02775 [Methylobacterium sp. J-072]|uniref:hypothetical protein n=1 Tax=Methylobacterium sp. J-072 TaxID=2836651 RepID=UPI001FB8D99A|nr:hypothetical protein [Methylobacterium sp. J-072]MCJ2091437.1 hypothetical protein [Methylobacterium sp. J-072]
MNYERQKRLVERLLDRTQAGELSWQEGVRPDTFQVSFPNNSVQVIPIDNGKLNEFQIAIIDHFGRVVDNVTNAQLDRFTPHPSGPWSSVMKELYVAARRSAFNADAAIDNILVEIE